MVEISLRRGIQHVQISTIRYHRYHTFSTICRNRYFGMNEGIEIDGEPYEPEPGERLGIAIMNAFEDFVASLFRLPPLSWLDRILGGPVGPSE